MAEAPTERGLGVGTYEVVREGEDVVIRINYEGAPITPSIEDNEAVMARAIDILAEVGHATKLLFSQKRDYEYDFTQTLILLEIAKLYKQFVKERLTYANLADNRCPTATMCAAQRYSELSVIIFRLLRSDPLGSYVELKRILRRETVKVEGLTGVTQACQNKYLEYLAYILRLLDATKLIQIARPYLAGFVPGDRGLYRKIFAPVIKPDFMYTKLLSSYPTGGVELASYQFGSTEVTIFSVPESIQTRYHVLPPEFRLSEEKYELLDKARQVLAEHKPTRQEFTDPERMRQVFFDVGSDLLEELSDYSGQRLKIKEIEELAQILVRYTVGFGLVEVLLADDHVQDITVNSPMGRQPAFIVHAEFGDCVTNIIPTPPEAESWASKLRLISGRPLDEANPILDTGLELPNASARIAVIGPPLNPNGLAFAFRRHRDKPWTLPLFIKYRMVNPLSAGIMSFLIDGARTLLVAGTRSAGKTSFLSSLLVEIMRRYRLITVEDTLELPVGSLRQLGFNIQPMKVASALTRGTSEVTAAEGIRTTLRMGDSSLIVGEVRSDEARALYEAMRVGALANVVAGTIHGDSPYGVYDRVVNDLNVPRTSFKATDIIIVANPIRSPDGLHRFRRVTQITEIRKHWEEDPLREGGFVDLMKYDPKVDELVPSPDLINGDSEILKSIAGNVREWIGNWDAVWDNITLRADLKKTLVDMSIKVSDTDMLEAPFVITANDQFHRISDEVRSEVGSLDIKRINFEWNEWLKTATKRRQTERHIVP